jgi:hypothetical protein
MTAKKLWAATVLGNGEGGLYDPMHGADDIYAESLEAAEAEAKRVQANLPHFVSIFPPAWAKGGYELQPGEFWLAVSSD